jgi:hypothetical protein
MNGNVVEEFFNLAKEITEELGILLNLDKLLNMDITGLPTNIVPENKTTAQRGKMQRNCKYTYICDHQEATHATINKSNFGRQFSASWSKMQQLAVF